MIGLTARQQQCLSFLRSYHAANGIMPSMDEISGHFGSPTRSMAARLLEGLEARGRIRRSSRKARAIEIVDPSQMHAVLLNREIFELVRAYAGSQRIGMDTACNELLRSCLDPQS